MSSSVENLEVSGVLNASRIGVDGKKLGSTTGTRMDWRLDPGIRTPELLGEGGPIDTDALRCLPPIPLIDSPNSSFVCIRIK